MRGLLAFFMMIAIMFYMNSNSDSKDFWLLPLVTAFVFICCLAIIELIYKGLRWVKLKRKTDELIGSEIADVKHFDLLFQIVARSNILADYKVNDQDKTIMQAKCKLEHSIINSAEIIFFEDNLITISRRQDHLGYFVEGHINGSLRIETDRLVLEDAVGNTFCVFLESTIDVPELLSGLAAGATSIRYRYNYFVFQDRGENFGKYYLPLHSICINASDKENSLRKLTACIFSIFIETQFNSKKMEFTN